MHSKNPGGRPKLYETLNKARKADNRKRQERRERAQLRAGPADFIVIEPSHPNIPAETPIGTGLRTSRDIQIPQSEKKPPPDIPGSLQLDHWQPAEPTTEESTEFTEQIRAARIREQET